MNSKLLVSRTFQRPKPAQGEIYHIYNRGVEKRNVFLDESDYLRFIHDLFEFNDKDPAGKFSAKRTSVGSPTSERFKRECTVDILAFCLMPNHYHLMIGEKKEGGITDFMRKIGTGYTNYFNKKYERIGGLFQGKYKIAHIHEDAHLRHLPIYIHLNPLDLITPEWREGETTRTFQAFKFLNSYRWSSYLDYAGKKNFPSILRMEPLQKILGNPSDQTQLMTEWIQRNGIEEIEHLALE